MATAEALKWWDEQFKKPENSTRVDAEERMFRNTPMAAASSDSNPINDALWLDDAELAERQHIQRQVNAYEESAAVSFCGLHDYHIYSTQGVYLGTGQRFVDKQRRRAYSMLEEGYDAKQVAVATYRDVTWVEDLRREFQL